MKRIDKGKVISVPESQAERRTTTATEQPRVLHVGGPRPCTVRARAVSVFCEAGRTSPAGAIR